jgi:hypothetical protein
MGRDYGIHGWRPETSSKDWAQTLFTSVKRKSLQLEARMIDLNMTQKETEEHIVQDLLQRRRGADI